VNGVSQTETVVRDGLSADTTTAVPFEIGARNGVSIPFDGSIDEVMIFERALTQAEIDQLYAYGNG
jgi:hypothetical protein